MGAFPTRVIKVPRFTTRAHSILARTALRPHRCPVAMVSNLRQDPRKVSEAVWIMVDKA